MPKTLLLLRTSSKTQVFQVSRISELGKPLLRRLWVVLGSQMRPHGVVPGGSTNHDFRRPDRFWPAHGPFGLWDLFPTPSQVSF